MKSLVHALHRTRSSGIPLPDRFPSLAQAGIRFRRGQVHMICGRPGAGKSLLALDYAVHAGVNTLYISADSDEDTVFNRVAAQRLNMEVAEVEEMRGTPAQAILEEDLAELRNIKFVYNPNPSLDDIDEELAAWNEVYGAQPDLIVVDNLMNCQPDGNDQEYLGYVQLTKAFHEVARHTGSAMIVLHHTSESTGKPTEPQGSAAVMGKTNAMPEVVITVALEPELNEFRLAAVKNRNGKADASARTWITLYVDLAKMKLAEHPLVAPEGVRSEAVDRYWSEINGQ